MPDDILEKTVKIVQKAGDKVISFYKSADLVVLEKSPDNPLSEADIACDSFLKTELLHIFPSAGWLSEETIDSFERLDKEFVWIVDPIDGTKEFVLGVPEFSISVGLVQNGETILGVVYNPATKELYYAGKNTPVYCVGVEIQTTNIAVTLHDAKVDASNSEIMRGEFEQFAGYVGKISAVGSIAYKLARLSAGSSDATWSREPKSYWDICAGVHLIKQSDAIIKDLDGNDFLFNTKKVLVNGLIASRKDLYSEVFDMLLPHRTSARR
jgi:myo-inositol-1(or 4)-monophosphatase